MIFFKIKDNIQQKNFLYIMSKQQIFVQFLYLPVLFFICMFSCSSNKGRIATDNGIMYAMIYDYDNVAVSGVLVKVNGEELLKSDMQGRFILDFKEKGEYSIELTKPGYEKLNQKFEYNPMEVLYFKMITAEQLSALAEESLDRFDYEEAMKFIDRAYNLEPQRLDIVYLRALTLYLQKKYDAAKTVINKLEDDGYNGKYIKLLDDRIKENIK
jgi:tetratricopeptide (TPR) repeat protein